jgi:ABC-type multidrug transport system fused ATPase/permease subunit
VLWRAADTRKMWQAGVFKLCGDALGFVPVVGVEQLIGAVESGGNDGGASFAWLAAVVVGAVLQSICLHRHHMLVIREGTHVRMALAQAVFRKGLRMPTHAVDKGKIATMQSGDAMKIAMVFYFVHYLHAAPIQIVVALSLLYLQLGPASLIGFAVMVILAPVQRWMGKLIARFSARAVGHIDKRMRWMSEIVSGIRMVKFAGWEEAFAAKVRHERAAEVREKRRIAAIAAISTLSVSAGPIITALAAFASYVALSDEPLTARKAFTALTLFNILRLPLMIVPVLNSTLAGAAVSSKRFFHHMEGPEIDTYMTRVTGDGTGNDKESEGPWPVDEAVFVCGTFQWPASANDDRETGNAGSAGGGNAGGGSPAATTKSSPSADRPTTAGRSSATAESSATATASTTAAAPAANAMHSPQNPDVVIASGPTLACIHLTFKRGTLTTILGPVGSGKSSLLMAILGEIPGSLGNLTPTQREILKAERPSPGQNFTIGQAQSLVPKSRVHGGIAFCCQNPWVLSVSLRDNIIMHCPFDEARYKHTLAVCALESDIETLPAGDQTEIGEKGFGERKKKIVVFCFCFCFLVFWYLFLIFSYCSQLTPALLYF